MKTTSTIPNGLPQATGTATQDELSNLLQEVGTANPQELLGAGAKTSLGVAMVQATLITVALLGVLTFGPYLWSTPGADSAPKATPKSTPQETATIPTPPPATPENPKTAETAKTAPVSKEALEKLGVTDTKKADPQSNPLDRGPDDLLKDLDKK